MRKANSACLYENYHLHNALARNSYINNFILHFIYFYIYIYIFTYTIFIYTILLAKLESRGVCKTKEDGIICHALEM